MIFKVFSIYDQKAAAYLPPFVLPRAEMAQRSFETAINSDTHQFGEHPEDYTLFELGIWDDETAQFQLGTANSLGNGVEYVRTDSIQAMEGLSDATETPSNSIEPQVGNGT